MPSPLPISLFCLSNWPDPQRYSIGLRQLREAGFAVSEPPLPVPRLRQFAGDDAYRGADFNRAVSGRSGGLLMAVRGGSGAARALPYIDFEALKRSGKIVCGYSDTTALLLAAAANGCTRLLHGPMLCSSWALPPDSTPFQQEMDAFIAVLQGRQEELLPGWAKPTILRPGHATGTLFAANLTLLETLIGTPYLPDLTGAILVIEDVTAPAHDIDRKLNHLRQAGILEALGALVYGSFTDAEDAEFLPEIKAEYAVRINGPVLSDFPVGHDHPSITIPCNRKATLDAVDAGGISLRLQEPL